MPIDLATEQLLTLPEAARLLPGHGNRSHADRTTVWKWVRHGIRGVRLESIRIGGFIVTSREAIQRFADRLSGPDVEVSPPAHRSQPRIETDEERRARAAVESWEHRRGRR